MPPTRPSERPKGEKKPGRLSLSQRQKKLETSATGGTQTSINTFFVKPKDPGSASSSTVGGDEAEPARRPALIDLTASKSLTSNNTGFAGSKDSASTGHSTKKPPSEPKAAKERQGKALLAAVGDKAKPVTSSSSSKSVPAKKTETARPPITMVASSKSMVQCDAGSRGGGGGNVSGGDSQPSSLPTSSCDMPPCTYRTSSTSQSVASAPAFTVHHDAVPRFSAPKRSPPPRATERETDVPLSQQELDDLLDASDSISWRLSSPRKRSKGNLTSLLHSLHTNTPSGGGSGTPASAARTVKGARRRPMVAGSPAQFPEGEGGEKLLGVIEMLSSKVEGQGQRAKGKVEEAELDELLCALDEPVRGGKDGVGKKKGSEHSKMLLCATRKEAEMREGEAEAGVSGVEVGDSSKSAVGDEVEMADAESEVAEAGHVDCAGTVAPAAGVDVSVGSAGVGDCGASGDRGKTDLEISRMEEEAEEGKESTHAGHVGRGEGGSTEEEVRVAEAMPKDQGNQKSEDAVGATNVDAVAGAVAGAVDGAVAGTGAARDTGCPPNAGAMLAVGSCKASPGESVTCAGSRCVAEGRSADSAGQVQVQGIEMSDQAKSAIAAQIADEWEDFVGCTGDSMWEEVGGESAGAAPNGCGTSNDSDEPLCTCIVTGVEERLSPQGTKEKVLGLAYRGIGRQAGAGCAREVVLRGSWLDADVGEGDSIVVIARWELVQGVPVAVVGGGAGGMIVTQPGLLVKASVVGGGFNCQRKVVLQERYARPGGEATMMGQLVHKIFQETITRRDWSKDVLIETVDRCLAESVLECHAVGLASSDARNKLLAKIPAIQEWSSMFLRHVPDENAPLIDVSSSGKDRVCATRVVDIEEMVKSCKYGVTGQIDAVVEISGQAGVAPILAPLELKTGKKSYNVEHNTQAVLYSMMMSDSEYGTKGGGPGLLVYLNENGNDTRGLPVKDGEAEYMMQTRNRLAFFLSDSTRMPEVTASSCDRCYARTECAVVHRLAEGGEKHAGLDAAKWEEEICGLTDAHAAYFKDMERAISLEEQDSVCKAMDMWVGESAEREEKRQCMGSMEMVRWERCDGDKGWRYFFIRGGCRGPGVSIEELKDGMAGSRVHVWREGGGSVLGFGQMEREGACGEVRIVCERPVKKAIAGGGGIWRIDRVEYAGGSKGTRANLMKLFKKGGDDRRRRLVVDLEAPVYADSSQVRQPSDASKLAGMELNQGQQEALMRCICAKDYVLLLGMPGTGKTTTIAATIKGLLYLKKRILVTAYTNNALDNVLIKLKELGVAFSRIVSKWGERDGLHESIKDCVMSEEGCKTTDELASRINDVMVIGATCIQATSSSFLAGQVFDVCICDEASQVTQPNVLGPLSLSNTFVLVGDHNQLPPLVHNKEAKKLGLGTSLFERLSNAHPDSVVTLSSQYRMCEQIAALANHLIYNGELTCGTKEVADRRLALDPPVKEGLASWAAHGRESALWVQEALDPAQPVVFIDSTAIAPLETDTSRKSVRDTGRRESMAEATMVALLADAAVTCGVAECDIGIISPFRLQLAAIEAQLAKCGRKAVEVCTVDRYQGRDKEVILLSLVRNNTECKIGDLLSDFRRINVAITRARSKLIVVGSANTISGDERLSKMVEFARDKGRFLAPAGMQMVEGTPHWCMQDAWSIYRKKRAGEEAKKE